MDETRLLGHAAIDPHLAVDTGHPAGQQPCLLTRLFQSVRHPQEPGGILGSRYCDQLRCSDHLAGPDHHDLSQSHRPDLVAGLFDLHHLELGSDQQYRGVTK